MPLLTDKFYSSTNNKKTNHYIETGTYLGDGIKSVMDDYSVVHSIELAEKWYDYNVEQFKGNTNVKMYLGDSKVMLKSILESINEPVTIYLDAHYSGGTTALGDEETPLLFELELLKQRQYDDIIIIDDCRLLEKSGTCGAEGSEIWPKMDYDWSDITKDKIKNLMKSDYILLSNEDNEYTDGASDQLVLCPKK